jgi:uncharacterized protein with PQ loop repeat
VPHAFNEIGLLLIKQKKKKKKKKIETILVLFLIYGVICHVVFEHFLILRKHTRLQLKYPTCIAPKLVEPAFIFYFSCSLEKFYTNFL